MFGFANHLDYLPVLSHLAERGETYYPNHSVNGLLNRLMSVAEPELYRNLDWGDGAFPPFNRLVYWTTTISSAAILLLALLRRNRDNDPDRVVDFCTMAVSATVASPIAWEHHYGVLLPVFAVVLVGALPQPRPAAMADRELRAGEQLFHRDAAPGTDDLEFRAVLSAVCDLDPAGAAAPAAARAAGARRAEFGRTQYAGAAVSRHAIRSGDAPDSFTGVRRHCRKTA